MIHPLNAMKRRKYRIPHILSIVLRIVVFVSLLAFAVSFQSHAEITSFTIFYGRFILPPLLILLLCIEVHNTNSEKAKIFRRFSQFEETAKAQELTESSSSEPFYEHLCTYYAKSKLTDWVEEYADIAIRNFEKDKSLSLYSLAMYEQEIKKNWDKYKGRKVITDGFALTSFSGVVFIAYPFFDDIPNDINSNNYIYSKIDEEKAKAYLIKYHQLVFRSTEKNLINQALNMINSKWVSSDNKQMEIDPGTKVILTGTLDMDKNGKLTLTNCNIEKNDLRARIDRQINNEKSC